MPTRLLVFIFFFNICLCHILVAQSPQVIISGFIKDTESGENLVGAPLQLIGSEQKGTTTDNFGHYSIPLPKNQATRIRITYFGFNPLDTLILLGQDTNMDFGLSGLQLRTVDIMANPAGTLKHNIVQIPVERLKAIPTLFGQPDLIKALAFVPGVSTGTEGTTGLYVRGGTPDQNLLLLDGATVYNASHLFGFQSVFDPSAIKDIKLYKGGFPARYGGRLSSIIDITMKEGNNQQHKGEVTLGLINSSLMLEGPLQKGRSSYMISGRAAYLGILLLPTWFSSRKNEDKPFNTMLSNDFNIKINHEFGNKDKIFGSFYWGDDQYVTRYKEEGSAISTDLKWGNRTASLRYIHSFGSRCFSNTLINYTAYHLKESYKKSNPQQLTDISFLRESNIREIALKQQFSINLKPKYLIIAGFELIQHEFNPDNIAFRSATFNLDSLATTSQKFTPLNTAVFVENEWSLYTWFTVNGGLRASFFNNQKSYRYIEPRINITARHRTTSFNIAYSRTAQFIHLLANNSLGLFSDLWVPATSKVAPQLSDQISGGIIFKSTKLNLEGSVEGYYKKMYHQIDYQQGIDFFSPGNFDWQQVVATNGKGRSRGIEWMLKKETARYNGWISYTLSWNERQFDEINKGVWYPFRYDRRHNLNITTNYNLSQKWKIGTNFIYQTGARITLPSGVMKSNTDYANYDPLFQTNTFSQTFYVSGRNNQKLPAYHRMDLSLTKSFHSRKKHRPSQLSFGVYNLYARRNPYSISVGSSLDPLTNTYKFGGSSRALFVFIPSIAYNTHW